MLVRDVIIESPFALEARSTMRTLEFPGLRRSLTWQFSGTSGGLRGGSTSRSSSHTRTQKASHQSGFLSE